MQFISNTKELGESIGRTTAGEAITLIPGNTGTGRTVLAKTICCYNTGKTHPSAYMVSRGLKPRSIDQMKSLNIGFVKNREKDLFCFMSPLVAPHSLVNNF